MQFIKSGILSTFQDNGRNGYRYMGINPNGAMDKMAVRLLNILLQNNENEAAVEIHFPGPEVLIENDSVIAIGGADFGPYLINENQKQIAINNWQCARVAAGNILRFRKQIQGQRAYISVKGGLDVREWLGSKSSNTLLGLNTIRPDYQVVSPAYSTPDFLPYLGFSLQPSYATSPVLRLIKGNEYGFLTKESKQILEEQSFTISQNSNRMGFRLIGEALSLENKTELISSAVDFGTIQLLPDGQMIVLMADHQTTGGYPRVANVISVDLPLLAQCGANDMIRFQFISLAEAEELLMAQEREITKLKATIRLLSKQNQL